MDIQIRRMSKEDIPAVVEIEQLCFSEPWTAADYNESLLLPYAAYYVAVSGNVILGMCGVRKICGEGQISNVAVKPAFQGQGSRCMRNSGSGRRASVRTFIRRRMTTR